MHLLLPPSEGKTVGGRGRPLRSRPPTADPLSAARGAAIGALLELVAGDAHAAADALLLPDGVAAPALALNAGVLDSATTPALRRYAGVVYDGLGFAGLSTAEQGIAARSTLIFSGLLGVVRGDEPVPAYRVPAKAVLPGLGVASTFWRPVLADVLPSLVRRGLVVDLRSGDYAAMWRPGRAVADRVVVVRVLSPAPRGGHAVISYNSKFAKGRLAAALVRRVASGLPVASLDDLGDAWIECGGADHVANEAGSLDLYTG
ncbi:MAG: uncharacterized protein QOG01_1010 [Pseudonocardiales bacterium]|nr:uncharacterized protein [Pseudonocardiales bacterium]